MGRAARHINSQVIMYADVVTKSMKKAIDEVERRRNVQIAYNKKHKITPKGINKSIRARLVEKEQEPIDLMLQLNKKEVLLPDEKEKLIKHLAKDMRQAALQLDFETAVILRDQIQSLKNR